MTLRLLAHSGGFSWDELTFLLAPLVILGALLAAARRKATAEPEEAEDGEAASEEAGEGDQPRWL